MVVGITLEKKNALKDPWQKQMVMLLCWYQLRCNPQTHNVLICCSFAFSDVQ